MNIEFKEEPGWVGAFTRNQVAGAIPNGTRITKVRTEPGDAHPLGTEGVVLGSLCEPVEGGRVIYFVEWATRPKVAVGVMDSKIGVIE